MGLMLPTSSRRGGLFLPWPFMTGRYGRYEVLYKLGQGAMAQVFLARDPVLSRFVAVKVLHAGLASRQDVLQRFFNEARTVALIRNPHVVEVFDFGREGSDLYQVMEFMDGLSLHGLLRRGTAARSGAEGREGAQGAPGRAGGDSVAGAPASPGYAPLDPLVAASLLCQAAEGISIAAAHGVVHRDLKPENLMLNGQGYLKISDFGIAHVQDDKLTRTGAVLGSPLYMSPEQARGLKPITAQSDMFSLGAVLYACLSGRPPFRARTVTELFRRIAEAPHVPLSELRPGLDPYLAGLADILLRKSPGDRGGGPLWLHRELKAYLAANGVLDAAGPAAACLRELKAAGLETPWKLESAAATIPGTVAATRPARSGFPIAGKAETSAPGREDRRPGADLADTPVPRRSRSGRAIALMATAFLGIGIVIGGWGAGFLERVSASLPSGRPRDAVPGGGDRSGMGSAASPAPSVDVGRSGLRSSSPPGRISEADPERLPDQRYSDRVDRQGMPGNRNAEHDRPSETSVGRDPGAVAAARGAEADRKGGLQNARLAIGGSGDALHADLILKSSPPFAEAFLDGRFIGVTPVRVESFLAGRHRLAMRSDRIPGVDTLVDIPPGKHTLKVRLGNDAVPRIAASPGEGE